MATEGGNYFKATVKKARAAIQQHAEENYQLLRDIIKMAAGGGDFETAAKYTAWLIEHTPPEDGESVIAESSAKPKQLSEGPRGPVIQIGVKVGGLSDQKELPAPVTIDVDPIE